MIRPSDAARAKQIERLLQSHTETMPGIQQADARKTLVSQLVESLRRIEYLKLIAQRPVAQASFDPNSGIFDPLKAAIHFNRAGNVDEAWWMVFLAAHFGRHRRTGWKLSADIYGLLNGPQRLSWHRVSSQPDYLQQWLILNEKNLASAPGRGSFGNHRKYETLSPSSDRGTGKIVKSYVAWVGANRGHGLLLAETTQGAADRFSKFDALYRSMAQVLGFGRTGRFDYLTLIGNLGLAPIEPGIPYLQNATGPLRGSRLLFAGDVNAQLSAKFLSDKVVDLGKHTQLGMQVFEDALCNWQKSPMKFVPFRG